jgi:peptide deformylase
MNRPPNDAGFDPKPRDESVASRPSVSGLSLVLYPDQVLRTVCQPVETFDSALRDLADKMISLMHCHSGIGLAAPQIGLRQRLIVSRIEVHPLVLANLEVKDCTEPQNSIEGCLSLLGIMVKVRRPERIRVSGYDVHGHRKSFAATGLWARVIQHELDHLNGVLICDYGPPSESGEECPLALPAALVEEHHHESHPFRPH